MRDHIPDESVDLCYIDPPFNSKRNYNQIYNNLGKEDVARSRAFTDIWEWDTASEEGFAALRDSPRQYAAQTVDLITGLRKVLGCGSLLAYLVSMTRRIAEIRRVLKETGSLYLHCDPTAGHYLKLVLDSVFCSQGGEFQNEIVWCYGSGGASKRHFSKKHDTIFFYTKSGNYTFHADAVREPYSSPEKSATPKRVGDKEYRKMNPLGRIPFDWWHIPILTNSSKERLGYPTQKPEALLERVIKASSREGDVVLDAYCGCGTTIAAAERLRRKWIGIDITYQSIALIVKRLRDTFGEKILQSITLAGAPKDLEGARALAHKKDDRTRREFEKWAVLTYSDNRAVINEKKGADRGIDGRAYTPVSADSFREVLFSVKSGAVNVGMVRDLRGVIERENAAAGIFITLEAPSKPMLHEAAQAGFYTSEFNGAQIPRIQIVTVEDILAGARMGMLTVDVYKKAAGAGQPVLNGFPIPRQSGR
jgi:site-specific DNA-methyltransferase (adenine-specific)